MQIIYIYEVKYNYSMNSLLDFGIIPIDYTSLRSIYPAHKSLNDKISDLKNRVLLFDLREECMLFLLKFQKTHIYRVDCQPSLWTFVRIYGKCVTVLWINTRKSI